MSLLSPILEWIGPSVILKITGRKGTESAGWSSLVIYPALLLLLALTFFLKWSWRWFWIAYLLAAAWYYKESKP